MLLAALGAAFLVSAPVNAQMLRGQCVKSEVLKKWLADVHAEYPVWSGMVGGIAVVIYGNDKMRTWTIARFSPRGVACVIIDGNEMNRFPPPAVIPTPQAKGRKA
jgi:hypothetical protein